MPDQPDDPIHYEMKIPPETHESNHEDGSARPPADDTAHDAGAEDAPGTAKDTSVVRGDDKPQAARQSR